MTQVLFEKTLYFKLFKDYSLLDLENSSLMERRYQSRGHITAPFLRVCLHYMNN